MNPAALTTSYYINDKEKVDRGEQDPFKIYLLQYRCRTLSLVTKHTEQISSLTSVKITRILNLSASCVKLHKVGCRWWVSVDLFLEKLFVRVLLLGQPAVVYCLLLCHLFFYSLLLSLK